MNSIVILGTRGVPARHGGFETFAERLARYLVARGWRVTVYCQVDGTGAITEDSWEGIGRVHIPVSHDGAKGTVEFDWRCISHLLRRDDPGLVLTLGYNTAAFGLRLRLAGVRNVINMDGIEWKRDKWRFYERAWLYLNERLGCLVGNHLIADHPEIANHLATRVARGKITTIPYGADAIEDADAGLLRRYGLEPDRYAVVIARPEPENSILEMVRAFSRRPRAMRLVMLGSYKPELNPFHARVLEAASEEVLFPGAIYEPEVVAALRLHARLYIHGHRVGGTNPSLVEALGAGSPVLAHDNRFNRWVAGSAARYFSDEDACGAQLDELLAPTADLSAMRLGSRQRHAEELTWERVLAAYEILLLQWQLAATRYGTVHPVQPIADDRRGISSVADY